jgi:hypothetical protein
MVCAPAIYARAEPRSDPTAGRAVFTGAATPSATSIEVNPAALELASVSELYLGATAIGEQLAIHPLGGAPADDFELGPGGEVAIVYHTKGHVTVAADLRMTTIAQYAANQPALAYHTLGGHERSYSGSVAAAIRVIDELSFGVSFTEEDRHLRLQYARDIGYGQLCDGAPCGLGNPLATQTYDVSVHSASFPSTDGLSVNVGLVYLIGKDTFLAAAYHAPPGLAIQTSLTGNMHVTLAPIEGGGIVRGGGTVNLQDAPSADAEFRTRLPRQLDLHVGLRWSDLSRFHAYDVRGYGEALSGAGVPEWQVRPLGYHDPVAVWAGVEQFDRGEQVRLGGRLGIVTSAIAEGRTSPLVVAPMSFTVDVGAQLRLVRLSPHLTLQISYGLEYAPTLSVRQSVFAPEDVAACASTQFDYTTPACRSVRDGWAIASAAGDYQRIEHSLRVALRYALP